MRSLIAVATALVAASCAHPGPGTAPTLAGSLNGYHFDRESITGVHTSVTRTASGRWIGQLGTLGWLEAAQSDGLIETTFGSVPVTEHPRYVAVHEYATDLIFRRADGGPVPEAIVLPLWIATRPWWPGRAGSPSGSCVDVEGIGTVLVLSLPRRAAPYDIALAVADDITLEEGCLVRFIEPVAQGGPLEVDLGR
jgi:hypothetical protein